MIARKLDQAIKRGTRQIGQIAILRDVRGARYALCHLDDVERLDELEVHHAPDDARSISTWASDGHYRFTKGELSLIDGWLMLLDDVQSLQLALDFFYPGALGLWIAQSEDRLEVQNLRDKLNRQTGMYKYAGKISDAGAQQLVRDVCGPGNCCVKKILWQIDADTPLEDSEAARFNGIVGDEPNAIPLLCREACNHFVAETRKASKAEADAAKANS